MSIISFCTAFLLSSFIINSCLHHHVAGGNPVTGPSREALEIIIGGGGGGGGGGGYYAPAPSPEYEDCPPPPPPPIPVCPTPLPPPPPPCPPPSPPPCPPPPPPPPPKSPPPPPPKSPPPPPPSPPPPPPPSPPPPPPPSPRPPKPLLFASKRIELVFPVIQKFKDLILSDPKGDPKGITKSWKGNDVCNKYQGFTCDIVPGYNVTALAGVNFNGYGFGGPKLNINGFIDKLPDVSIFHANSNNFTGPVPKLSHLQHLYELDLSNNKYIGGFPYETLAATNLTFLDLRFNAYSGTVPPQVFLLDLDVLFINNNNFLQTLPDNLGSTPVLFLTLANNKFIGPIPKSIGRAANTLLEVLFLNNQLSGCLPYEIGFLKKATVFDVGSNFLTGPIPHSFACLAKMERLNLARNQFYDTVPERVCQLPNMVNLTLSHNYFTQVGPACRNLISKHKLDVRMNCILDLPFQRSAAECAAFFSKSRQCPNEPSFNKIPCLNILNSEALETSDHQWMAPDAAGTRSYDALSPNGL